MAIILSSMKAHSWDEIPLDNKHTPEEASALRQITLKFLQRQIEHPEITNLSKDSLIKMMHDENLLGRYFIQEHALHAETYFELKDELALKGIEIFDPAIENSCCSYEVLFNRAQMMVSYIKEHPEMLPDGLTVDELSLAAESHSAYSQLSGYLAEAWCYVYKQKLAGIDFCDLEQNDECAVRVYKILNNLHRWM